MSVECGCLSVWHFNQTFSSSAKQRGKQFWNWNNPWIQALFDVALTGFWFRLYWRSMRGKTELFARSSDQSWAGKGQTQQGHTKGALGRQGTRELLERSWHGKAILVVHVYTYSLRPIEFVVWKPCPPHNPGSRATNSMGRREYGVDDSQSFVTSIHLEFWTEYNNE